MNNIYGDNEILKHLNFEDRESCHEPYLKKTVLRSGVYLLQPLYKKVEELCNRNWRNATVYIEEK